jgi:hypothetical protein
MAQPKYSSFAKPLEVKKENENAPIKTRGSFYEGLQKNGSTYQLFSKNKKNGSEGRELRKE